MRQLFCLFWVLFIKGTAAQSNNEELIQTINGFGIDLYKELIKKNENLVCSGYSVNTVLNMVLAGAKTSTETELLQALHYDKIGLSVPQIIDTYQQILNKQRNYNTGYELEVGNSIWIHQNFHVKPEFKQTIESKFFAEEQQVDFYTPAATDAINLWVSKATKGKIPKLLDEPLDTNTVMALVNAVYFKGTWDTQFKKELTETYPFKYNNGNSQKDILMMNAERSFLYTESSELNAQVLELPYNGKEVSMIVFLPKDTNDIAALEQKLTVNAVQSAIGNVRSQSVKVKLPKFDLSSSLNLVDILKSLGIKKMFDEIESDFSGIHEPEKIFVSECLQKAIIEVSEEGTVATAATIVVFASKGSALGSAPMIINFTADHPFLFFIVHKPTGLHLFSGRFLNPDLVAINT